MMDFVFNSLLLVIDAMIYSSICEEMRQNYKVHSHVNTFDQKRYSRLSFCYTWLCTGCSTKEEHPAG